MHVAEIPLPRPTHSLAEERHRFLRVYRDSLVQQLLEIDATLCESAAVPESVSRMKAAG